MAESCVVEIYEHETFHRLKGWIENVQIPWTLKSTNDACKPPDEITLPNAEWVWTSNWKIDKKPGETDADGWEYASKFSRFAAGKQRAAKAEKSWSDKARRRLWARLMRREVNIGRGADLGKVMPKIQQGLSSIHTARIKIEDICRQSPEASGSDQMQVLVHSVKKNIADIMQVLDQVDEQASSSKSSQTTGVVKKLRNDVLREEIAIEKALNPSTEVAKSHGGVGGKKAGSSWFSNSASNSSGADAGRNSFSNSVGMGSFSGSSYLGGGIAGGGGSFGQAGDRGSFNAGRPSFNGNGNSFSTRPSNASVTSTTSAGGGSGSGGGAGKGVSGLTAMNLEAQADLPPVPPSPNHAVGRKSSAPVKGGGANSFTPAALSQVKGGIAGNSGSDWGEAEDGVFVDRDQQELQIEAKFVAIDEATIMQEIIDDRAEAIQQINKGIVDLNEMFVDLSKIVKMQDVEVTAIYSNVDESHARTKEAFKHIIEANRIHQSNTACVLM